MAHLILKRIHLSSVPTLWLKQSYIFKISYDQTKITYEDLVHRFLTHIDPTDSGRPFHDRGDSYSNA